MQQLGVGLFRQQQRGYGEWDWLRKRVVVDTHLLRQLGGSTGHEEQLEYASSRDGAPMRVSEAESRLSGLVAYLVRLSCQAAEMMAAWLSLGMHLPRLRLAACMCAGSGVSRGGWQGGLSEEGDRGGCHSRSRAEAGVRRYSIIIDTFGSQDVMRWSCQHQGAICVANDPGEHSRLLLLHQLCLSSQPDGGKGGCPDA